MTAMPGTCNWNSFPVTAVSLLARSSALKDPISSSKPFPPPPPPPPASTPDPWGYLVEFFTVSAPSVLAQFGLQCLRISVLFPRLNTWSCLIPSSPQPPSPPHSVTRMASSYPHPPPPPVWCQLSYPPMCWRTWDYLRTQRQGHHTIGRLEKVGVERRSAISTFFLQRTRTGHHRLDTHWNCFTSSLHQGNEREKKKERKKRGGGVAHTGFPECVDTILNWINNILNWLNTVMDWTKLLIPRSAFIFYFFIFWKRHTTTTTPPGTSQSSTSADWQ